MRITTSITIDIDSGQVLDHQFYEYSGPVDLACGASGEQKQAYAQEVSLENQLLANYQTIFSGNQSILKTLTSVLTPTVQAGPDQFGFSPAEESAQRTMAAEQLSSAGRNEVNAVRGAEAARGAMNLPSGSEAAIEAGLAADTAQKEAEAQLGITEQGYQVGRENYFKSLQALGAAPGQLENPATAAASPAISGAGLQQQGAQAITQANQAWMAPVAGIIGSVAGAALGNPMAGANAANAAAGPSENPFGESDTTAANALLSSGSLGGPPPLPVAPPNNPYFPR